MKLGTILLLVLCLALVIADDTITDCTKIRVGTKPGATDVMLDGEPTEKYKRYKYTKSENDVEVASNINESVFYIHNIKLDRILEVRTQAAREKLLTLTTTVTSDGSDNKSFSLRVGYDCTRDLSGITDVFLTFVLDGTVCESNIVGIRKKCGSEYAYAPIEISEIGYWGMKQNILTDDGGKTTHPENLFDKKKESKVIKKNTNKLNFRVKNKAIDSSTKGMLI